MGGKAGLRHSFTKPVPQFPESRPKAGNEILWKKQQGRKMSVGKWRIQQVNCLYQKVCIMFNCICMHIYWYKLGGGNNGHRWRNGNWELFHSGRGNSIVTQTSLHASPALPVSHWFHLLASFGPYYAGRWAKTKRVTIGVGYLNNRVSWKLQQVQQSGRALQPCKAEAKLELTRQEFPYPKGSLKAVPRADNPKDYPKIYWTRYSMPRTERVNGSSEAQVWSVQWLVLFAKGIQYL